MVSMMSCEIFTKNDRTLRGATAVLKLELRKNAPLFAITNVIFEVSVSFSAIYQNIVFAFQFSFNNTVPTLTNLSLLKLSRLSDCQFFLLPQAIPHVVAGCKKYLEQSWFTWCHNFVLKFLAMSMKVVEGS